MQGLDNYKTATPDWMNRNESIDYPKELELQREEAKEAFLYLAEETKYCLLNGTTEDFMHARSIELLAWDDFLAADKKFSEALDNYNNQ
jgi:hypothetical protein